MKTIAPKDAFKLFLFVLILFSAKTFSFTRLPNDANSNVTGSKFGNVNTVANMPKTSSNTLFASARGRDIQSNKIALRNNLGPRVSLKFGW
jgi:hypothetical protein